MTEALPDIPRLVTGVAEWLGVLVYLLVLPRRLNLLGTIGVALAGLAALVGLQLVAGRLPIALWTPAMLAAATLGLTLFHHAASRADPSHIMQSLAPACLLLLLATIPIAPLGFVPVAALMLWLTWPLQHRHVRRARVARPELLDQQRVQRLDTARIFHLREVVDPTERRLVLGGRVVRVEIAKECWEVGDRLVYSEDECVGSAHRPIAAVFRRDPRDCSEDVPEYVDAKGRQLCGPACLRVG